VHDEMTQFGVHHVHIACRACDSLYDLELDRHVAWCKVLKRIEDLSSSAKLSTPEKHMRLEPAHAHGNMLLPSLIITCTQTDVRGLNKSIPIVRSAIQNIVNCKEKVRSSMEYIVHWYSVCRLVTVFDGPCFRSRSWMP